MNFPFDNFIPYPIALVLRSSKKLFIYLSAHEFTYCVICLLVLYENCSLPLMVFLPCFLFLGALLDYFQDGRDEGETNMTEMHQHNLNQNIFFFISM